MAGQMAHGEGATVLELPFARPVAAAHAGIFRSSDTSVPVPADLLASIKGNAVEARAEARAVVLAAFHAVVARYTGTFSLPIASVSDGGRVTSVPGEVADSASLQDSIRIFDAALKNGEDIPKGGAAGLMFHYSDHTETIVKVTNDALATCPGGFKWLLSFSPGRLALAYDAHEFAEEDMASLAGHVLQVLGRMSSPGTPVRTVDILTPHEHHTLQEQWNNTACTFPDVTISQLLEQHAKAHPAAVAVATFQRTGTDGQPALDAQLTYAELNSRANRVAHHLRSVGVGRGTYVGIYIERSCDLLVGLFAILKAGGAYVPLDPVYPLERLGMMLEDSAPPCVLTQASLAAAITTVTPPGAAVVSIDGADAPAIAACPDGDISDGMSATPRDVAYAIFTSGSTGRPKGVPIRHESVVNLLVSEKKLSDMGAGETLLAITTVCFDIAGLEMFMPVLAGGRVVIASRDQAHDAEALTSLLHVADVSVLQATPSTWRMLVRSGWRGRKSLRAMIGGEALPAELAEELVPLVRTLLNVYGPTETTIWSTTAVVDLARPTSIGHPLDNTTVYVLDAALNPLPAGIAGELHIGGVGLSPGYLGLPAMTAERFIPSPFARGERLYKTGDLARFCKDGTLECLGRLDFQVKIRGYRIELGEIEAVLGGHGLCAMAVCDAKDVGGDGDKQLIAYVVPSSSSASSSAPAAAPSSAPAAAEEQGAEGGGDSSAKDLDEVNAWGAIYDEAYASANAVNDDPTLNFSGYDNSYTPRIPHRSEVVREWVETTCDRIDYLKPKRCVEMGCGNGMIMLRCAAMPWSEMYIGTDLSEEAIRYCEDVLEKNPRFKMPHVSVDLAGAHESNRYKDKNIDCVVCNGVSMYFPSADYLIAVCAAALDGLQPGGHFFLGDVRNALLLEHFHASVRVFQAPAEMSVRELRRVVRRAIAYEKELLVDPALFTCAVADRLPWMDWMELHMKRGYHRSEFAMYRYDVTLGKCASSGGAPRRAAAGKEVALEDWAPGVSSLDRVRAVLSGGRPEVIGYRGLPDARLAEEDALVEGLAAGDFDPSTAPATCGELREAMRAHEAGCGGVEPEDAYRLAEELGYRAQCFWTPGRPCHFDVLMVRDDVPRGSYEPLWVASRRAAWVLGAEALNPLGRYTSKWGQESLQEEVNAKDGAEGGSGDDRAPLPSKHIAELQDALRQKVPEYMVPKIFVAMGSLPMTANGKVDRKALPPPAPHDLTAARRVEEFVDPSGATEEALAEGWRDLLKVPEVSALDDFFEIGGHSLMAMQLVQQIKARFGVKLSLFRLTEASQLRELAALVDSEIAALSRGDPSAGGDAGDDEGVRIVKQADLPMTFEVETVDIPLRDGVRLSARLWRPVVRGGGATPKSPAVVEILPYRKSDGTVEIDSMTFPYLAGHGLACLRIDARGCGDSEGHLDDEYSERQQLDAVECIDWAARQDWCSGKVGAMGCSWGGFTALQAAARQPPALKAVVAVCSTDDRFADDMHYMGGALLHDNLTWGAWMAHTVSQPPDPEVVGSEEWQSLWEERLERLAPPFRRWLKHGSKEDPYWATGSVSHDLGRIWCPVFAVGGWNAGGYANAVPRLAANLAHTKCKALLGPWSHNYPHTSPLGPAYGFLKQVTRWFRHHLMDEENGIMAEPLFEVYAARPTPGAPPAQAAAVPGRWLSAPSQAGLPASPASYALSAGAAGLGMARGAAGSAGGEEGAAVEVPAPVRAGGADPAGQSGGAWFTFGMGADLPTDQAPDDARSASFDTAPLAADLVVLGRPAARLRLRFGGAGAREPAKGVVAARLCAVGPDGVSHRITYGVCNLAKNPPLEAKADLGGGARGGGEGGGRGGGTWEVDMDYIAYTVPAGFRLRLAVSSGYWPILWPTPVPEGLAILPAASALVLPEVGGEEAEAAAASAAATPAPPVEVFEPVSTSRVRRGEVSRAAERKAGGGVEVRLVDDRGARRLEGPLHKGLVLDASQRQTYALGGDGSAAHVVEFRSTQQRVGGGWDAESLLRAEMTLEEGGEIRICTRVEARSEGRPLFKREYVDWVPANGL